MRIILIYLAVLFSFKNLIANEPKLEEIIKGFNKPWSLSFINNDNIIITEKSGNLFQLNLDMIYSAIF